MSGSQTTSPSRACGRIRITGSCATSDVRIGFGFFASRCESQTQRLAGIGQVEDRPQHHVDGPADVGRRIVRHRSNFDVPQSHDTGRRRKNLGSLSV